MVESAFRDIIVGITNILALIFCYRTEPVEKFMNQESRDNKWVESAVHKGKSVKNAWLRLLKSKFLSDSCQNADAQMLTSLEGSCIEVINFQDSKHISDVHVLSEVDPIDSIETGEGSVSEVDRIGKKKQISTCAYAIKVSKLYEVPTFDQTRTFAFKGATVTCLTSGKLFVRTMKESVSTKHTPSTIHDQQKDDILATPFLPGAPAKFVVCGVRTPLGSQVHCWSLTSGGGHISNRGTFRWKAGCHLQPFSPHPSLNLGSPSKVVIGVSRKISNSEDLTSKMLEGYTTIAVAYNNGAIVTLTIVVPVPVKPMKKLVPEKRTYTVRPILIAARQLTGHLQSPIVAIFAVEPTQKHHTRLVPTKHRKMNVFTCCSKKSKHHNESHIENIEEESEIDESKTETGSHSKEVTMAELLFGRADGRSGKIDDLKQTRMMEHVNAGGSMGDFKLESVKDHRVSSLLFSCCSDVVLAHDFHSGECMLRMCAGDDIQDFAMISTPTNPNSWGFAPDVLREQNLVLVCALASSLEIWSLKCNTAYGTPDYTEDEGNALLPTLEHTYIDAHSDPIAIVIAVASGGIIGSGRCEPNHWGGPWVSPTEDGQSVVPKLVVSGCMGGIVKIWRGCAPWGCLAVLNSFHGAVRSIGLIGTNRNLGLTDGIDERRSSSSSSSDGSDVTSSSSDRSEHDYSHKTLAEDTDEEENKDHERRDESVWTRSKTYIEDLFSKNLKRIMRKVPEVTEKKITHRVVWFKNGLRLDEHETHVVRSDGKTRVPGYRVQPGGTVVDGKGRQLEVDHIEQVEEVAEMNVAKFHGTLYRTRTAAHLLHQDQEEEKSYTKLCLELKRMLAQIGNKNVPRRHNK